MKKGTIEIEKDDPILSKLSMEDEEMLPVAETNIVVNKKEILKLPCINPMAVYPEPLDIFKN